MHKGKILKKITIPLSDGNWLVNSIELARRALNRKDLEETEKLLNEIQIYLIENSEFIRREDNG